VETKVIILTGASGGIGKSILPLLTELDSVIAIYKNNEIDEVLENVEPFKLDLNSEDEIKNFIKTMGPKLKNITIIHGASISNDSLAINCKTEDWDETMNCNLRADFILTRSLLSTMVNDKWGRVIHLSSTASVIGVPGTIAYSTSKAGLIGMSKVISKEYGRLGITSNVLMLGYFNTGLFDTLSEKHKKNIIESIPIKRLGEPNNIVNGIEYLIKSDYVNGSILNIDGGM